MVGPEGAENPLAAQVTIMKTASRLDAVVASQNDHRKYYEKFAPFLRG